MYERNAGRRIQDISPHDLKLMIADLLDTAAKVMGHSADDITWLVGWMDKLLSEKYGYLPFNYVRSAVEHGSLGELGGTSKLIPRNIAIWLKEAAGNHQEHLTRRIKADDEKKRIEHMNANKAEWQVAAAVRIKVTWLGEGLITSQEYDSFSSQRIYELLKAGKSERTIHPYDVVDGWHERRKM